MSGARRAPAAGVLLAILLGGCVYYNGMYNANRLAKSAKKAEREGRTFEAANLWGQVVTKAESVVVRHPTSKYAQQAEVLRGVALARIGHCEQALTPLSRAGMPGTPTELSEDALLATGRCQLGIGNIPAAQTAFSKLLDSKNSDRRREAHFQQARLLRQAERYDEALKALEGIRDPRADGERILALAGVGQVPHALALADSLIARRDTTKPWDSLVVAMGRQNPLAGSSLLDLVGKLPVRSPEVQARRLLEDGMRLAHTDTARAGRRFREAVTLSGTNDAAARASFHLVRMDIEQTRRPEDLSPLIQRLKGIADRFETVAYDATQLGAAATAVHGTGAVAQETPQADLRLFLAGEIARDSLHAPVLARGLFRRILDQWPASPYTPKAIFAIQQLDPQWADSARAILQARYFDSPYLAVAQGYAPSEYRQLEDSLGAFAATLSVQPKPRVGPPKTPVRDDLDQPRRRPPAPGTSRVPEP